MAMRRDLDRNPPVNYRHWRGGDRFPKVERAAEYWEIGHCPKPETRAEWFWYHLHHGLLMRYPFFDVLMFSWRSAKASQRGFDWMRSQWWW